MSGTAHLFLHHEPDKAGKHPVKLYVRLEGKPVRLATGVAVDPAEWDEENRRIRGRSEATKRQNLILARKITEANKILSDYNLMMQPLNKRQFVQEWKRPASRVDFLEFYRGKAEENFERRLFGPGTRGSELRTAAKLEQWSGGQVLFSAISRSWLEEFDAWHAEYLKRMGYDGLVARTRALKHIKKYLKAARDGGDRQYDFKWPFHGFVWPRVKTLPVFLSEAEVRALIALREAPEEILERMKSRAARQGMDATHAAQYACPEGVEKVQKVITWFLAQCFTGMRYSDLAAVTWRHIEGNHLVFVPLKTERSSGIEVRLYISKMIRQLMPQPPAAGRVSAKIWPVISNQKYNEYLKEVADLARIEKNLTTHVGRHTFATMALDRGIKLPVLQELMGVASLRTLMVYVHITERQLDDSMRQAFDGF